MDGGLLYATLGVSAKRRDAFWRGRRRWGRKEGGGCFQGRAVGGERYVARPSDFDPLDRRRRGEKGPRRARAWACGRGWCGQGQGKAKGRVAVTNSLDRLKISMGSTDSTSTMLSTGDRTCQCQYPCERRSTVIWGHCRPRLRLSVIVLLDKSAREAQVALRAGVS